MIRLVPVALVAILLGSCSTFSDDIKPSDKVRDERTAIEIGQKECSQGAKKGWAYTWHAKLDGDDWNVWSGPEYDGHHVMELKVKKSTGEASDCLRYAG
ncbi:MAG: hypothetical protein WBQ17_04630 [Rhizomicrobium sp.]